MDQKNITAVSSVLDVVSQTNCSDDILKDLQQSQEKSISELLHEQKEKESDR